MTRTELFGLPRGLLAVNAALFAAAVLGGLALGRVAGVLFAAAAFGAVVSVQQYGARSRRRDRRLHREASRLSNGESTLFERACEREHTRERGRGRDR